MDWLFTIFIFFVVIAITAMVFFGWVAFTIFSFVIRGISAAFGAHGGRIAHTHGPRAARGQHAPHTVRCLTQGCYTVNPADARFCRRCGRGLPAAQRAQVRRAAVW